MTESTEKDKERAREYTRGSSTEPNGRAPISIASIRDLELIRLLCEDAYSAALADERARIVAKLKDTAAIFFNDQTSEGRILSIIAHALEVEDE